MGRFLHLPIFIVRVALRVNLNGGPNGGPVVEPGSRAERHGHAAMSARHPAVYRIKVPDVSARAIDGTPPGVVQEEAACSPFQRVIDMRWGIPVG